MKKMLIVYYSWSNGNTKKIAKMLQKVNSLRRIISLQYTAYDMEIYK